MIPLRPRGLTLIISIFLLGATSLAACTKSTNEKDTPKVDKQLTSATAYIGSGLDSATRSVTLNFAEEPKTMDAQKADDTVALMLLSHTNEGLTRLDPKNRPFPAQAASWEVNSPTEYTFKIRPGALWSDGKQVTANDFAYAWRRGVDPKTASVYAFILYPLKNARAINEGKQAPATLGVKTVDQMTLKVTLEQPTAYFLRLLSFGTYFPVREDFVTKHHDNYAFEADKLLYNGPFYIKEWKHNASMKLAKNEQYWNKDSVWLNEINMPYLIRDTNSEFNMFKDGKYAMVRSIGKELLPNAQENKMQIRKYNTGSVWYFQINTTRKITGNKNFRKAMQHALDRMEYVKQVNGIPGAKPIYGVIPEYMPGISKPYGQEYHLTFKDADLKTAKTYLAAAKKELGITAFPTLGILASDNDRTKRDMEYFQRFFKEKLGLDFKLDFQTFKVRLERTDKKDFDIVNSGWGPDYLDAMTFADLFTSWNGNNNTGWSSKKYDQYIKDAMATIDQKKRLDAMHAAEKILVEEAPILPYFQAFSVYVQHPQLVGVIRRTISPDPDFYYARIDKKITAH